MSGGVPINDFDNMDYFDMLEGMNARKPEDRPKSMKDFLRGL